MAFGSTRRVAGTAHGEIRPRRWIAAVVWGVCLLSCLAFWIAVGLAIWWMVG